MTYYAHKKENEKQTLKEHCQNTAQLAMDFSVPQLRHCAYLVGMLHDVGKYSKLFQARLDNDAIRVEHSGCGAAEIAKLVPGEKRAALFQYVIAGHHSGLPNFGSGADTEADSTLCARLLQWRGNLSSDADYRAYADELDIPDVASAANELSHYIRRDEVCDDYEFAVRHLFSCLTDADFLDTETFMNGKRGVVQNADWADMQRRLDAKLRSFVCTTELQKSRAVLQEQALRNIERDCGFYLLDMPTGSGKTLCSMNLALKRLKKGNKKRIIYVIPYTSVIEQTAKEFSEVFPDTNILQHHSDFDYDAWDKPAKKFADENENVDAATMKKATENWDAPVVVTTNVQFFESIYGNKSGKLRKFHNMANSVIVFDEIHTLPISRFADCMRAVQQLVSKFNCEVIFLTATMPNFSLLVQKYLIRNVEMCNLLPDKHLFKAFEKCVFRNIGRTDILEKLDGKQSTLVVCNAKKTAEEMYKKYVDKKYCLSTYLTPNDRLNIIEAIRTDLRNDEKIVVFSTSLIEAGVDLDFQCVYRELAGLDNILQSAGRCNREGKRRAADSVVYIFQSERDASSDVKMRAQITSSLLETYGNDIASPQCVEEYFNSLFYTASNLGTMGEKSKRTASNFWKIDFESIARNFHYIESYTYPVVVPHKDIADELDVLRTTGKANRRKLQRYCASVSKRELERLIELRAVTNPCGGDIFVLCDGDRYSAETGIITDDASGQDIFY